MWKLNSQYDKKISKKTFGDINLKPYFCSNKSHHASQRCVPRWDFAFYIGLWFTANNLWHRWTISLAPKQRTDYWRCCKSQTTASQYQLFPYSQLSQIYGERFFKSSLQVGQFSTRMGKWTFVAIVVYCLASFCKASGKAKLDACENSIVY